MKIKKAPILAALMLTLMFPILTHQVLTEDGAYYVYPTIEFDAIKLNATAYRFHSGDTLNFTFAFTTQEGVLASFPEHYTDYSKTEKRGHLNITDYLDGTLTSRSYTGLGVEGFGRTWNERISTVTAGNHTINYNWLFTIDEDAEGYLEVNFLTEVKLKLEKLPTSSFPTQTLLTVGALGGASGAAIVGAVSFVNKRRNKGSKEKP